MLNFENKRIYLACGYTDMRKSINGLSAIVEGSFKLDPFSEALFVFCNRGRTRVKILEWDNDGFWLYLKRLEKGRFRWPTSEEIDTMELSDTQCLHTMRCVPKRLQSFFICPSSLPHFGHFLFSFISVLFI